MTVAAIAKVVLDYPKIRVTDHMALMKVDGQWKIVSKSFHAEPKSGPTKKPRAGRG